MTQRTDRVDELLRQEISELLAREVGDPRIGFATITDVETAPDLRHAKVWVSVIGPEPERDETLAALQHAMGYVQRELGHRLRLKRIPALHVRLDDTAERSTRVHQLLAGLEAGLVAEDLPRGETLPTPVARIRHGDDPGEEAPGDAEAEAADRPKARSSSGGRPHAAGAPRPSRSTKGQRQRGSRR